MSGLGRFERLEAEGLYAAHHGAPTRRALLSLGHATLTLADFDETPFAHWPLAGLALERLEDGGAAVSPGAEAAERVVVADTAMIEALQRARGAQRQPTPRRRHAPLAALAAGLAAALWLGVEPAKQALTGAFPDAAMRAVALEAATLYLGGRCALSASGLRAQAALTARLQGVSKLALGPGSGRAALAASGVLAIHADSLRDPARAAEAIAAALARGPAVETVLNEAGLTTLARYAITPQQMARRLARAMATAPERAAAPPPDLSGLPLAPIAQDCAR